RRSARSGERRWVPSLVVPAKAGTQWRVPVARSGERRWVPASAGTTERTFGRKTLGRKLRRPREGGDPVACSSGAFGRKTLGSRFRGNDGAHVRAKDAGFPLPRERRSARSGKKRWVPASAGTTERTFGRKTLGRKLRRPREGGDPGARSGRKTLGSRFRGNDGARVRAKDAGFPLPRERRCPRNAQVLAAADRPAGEA